MQGVYLNSAPHKFSKEYVITIDYLETDQYEYLWITLNKYVNFRDQLSLLVLLSFLVIDISF